MQLFLITGEGGTSTSLFAATTALQLAAQGRTTLLTSFGPGDSLSWLLEAALSSAPQQVAPNLHACRFDAAETARTLWERAQTTLSGPLSRVSGGEIPLLPGIDLFMGLERLRALTGNYAAVVLDAGSATLLLRALATPDGFRWLVRLLIGLDRGPGRSAQSQARALLPTSLLPGDWTAQMQEARLSLEALRDTATFAAGAHVAYTLPPDGAALAEARLAIPALQLHGLPVGALVAGPLLPATTEPSLVAITTAQEQLLAETMGIWEGRPVLRLPLGAYKGIAALSALAQQLYSGAAPDTLLASEQPIELLEGPALALSLPGLPRGKLALTLSGDELIVGIGPYRRHLLLPDGLRGSTAIRATWEGSRAIIRPRT